MHLYLDWLTTPMGGIALLASDRGLMRLFLPGEDSASVKAAIARDYPDAVTRNGGDVNRTAAGELEEYFAGRRKSFNVPLDMRIEGFYKNALDVVREIPYGRVRTYGEIAAQLGKSGAARAVGGANRSNPIPIIIPCHRVVASNSLGGYAGKDESGLDMKAWLLRHEGVDVKKLDSRAVAVA